MLLLNDQPIDFFVFSGGELQVKILNNIQTERATLTWKPTDAGEIALLLLTVSALKHMGFYDIDLDILYLPYARQDRVCAQGEAHSLEVICDVISHLDVSVVRLWDVHNKEKTLEMLNTLIHPRPTTGLEGKFSMQYCMAVLLVAGRAGLGEFTDAAVNGAAVQAMLRRVEFYNSPEADAAGADKMHSIIDITLKDGRAVRGVADFARGSPQFPMSFDDVVEKFRDCARYGGLTAPAAERVIAEVRALERVGDVRTLTRLLRVARA